MFFIVVGVIVGAVLAGAGWSDLRRVLRGGEITRIDDSRVQSGVRSVRMRSSRQRSFRRYRGSDGL